MSNPLRSLYNWTMRQARGKNAERALFGVSFAESSFFPIPPDVMLMPMVLAERTKAWRYTLICTVGSVVGGLAGYAIGFFLWEAAGEPILRFYHLEAEMATFERWYLAHGAWIILLAGFTPLPYKLFTIASGVFAFPLLPFVLLSVISRGARFLLVAGLLYLFGRPIKQFIETWLEWVTLAFGILLVGGFLAVKYLF